jgi:hypothetical protein
VKPSPEEAVKRVQAKAIRRHWRLGPPFDARIKRLVRDWGAQKSSALIKEMITTALKIARDEMTVADLKLINRSAKEMGFALNIRLPSGHRVNELIEGDPKFVTLNYFFTRKLSFVKEAHAFALFPMDEAVEVLTLMQTPKRALSRSCYWTGRAGNIGRRGYNFLPNVCLNLTSFRRKISRFSKSNTTLRMPQKRSRNFTGSFNRRGG